MLNWFDIQGLSSSQVLHPFLSRLEYAIYKWLRTQTLDKIASPSDDTDNAFPDQDFWKERKVAETALRSYLTDPPCMYARA